MDYIPWNRSYFLINMGKNTVLFIYRNYFIWWTKKNRSNINSIAELRTIGLCDETSDSELSIRRLELTPNTSENSFRLSPCHSVQKHSKESLDSGCQNETTTHNNGENIRNNDSWRDCDLNIVNITKHNSNSNNRKMETLDLTVNCRKSSSSTLSDASSCATNSRSTSTEQKKRKDSPKYHSVVRNRLRTDSTVSRSKSFQEQDVRKPSKIRSYVVRRNPQNDFGDCKLSKTYSHHNIEITIEDTDATDEQQPDNHCTAPKSQKRNRTVDSASNSRDSYYDRHKVRSGHVLSRIFRRMRKLSMGWRKSKNKSRNRGEYRNTCLIGNRQIIPNNRLIV